VKSEKNAMDGGGLSSGGRFRIGGLWPGNNDNAANDDATNDNTANDNTASGRKATVWGNDHLVDSH